MDGAGVNPEKLLAMDLISEMETMENDRTNFQNQWDEISRRMIPSSVNRFFQAGQERTKGQKNTDEMLDATAMVAHQRYISVVASLLTPQDSKWHRLRSSSPELNRIPRVRQYFDGATEILFRRRRSPKSGFYGQCNEAYGSVGAFGTGLVFIDYTTATPLDDTGGLRYRHTHLAETFIRENHQGFINQVNRKFSLPIYKIPGMLAAGYFDRMPDGAEERVNDPKRRTEEWTYLHVVKENTELDRDRSDFRGKPFVEYYVCEKTKEIIGRRGYRSFPYATARTSVSPGETYGTAPAMLVLPNIKVLNEQKKTQIKIGHRLADPALLAYDDGILDTFSARPGMINAGGLSKDGRKLVQRLDDNVGQMSEIKDLMDQERAVINDAFLVSLFQILTEQPRMTATEVLERTREKSMLLAPTMARLQSEFLGPLVERELSLLAQNGLLPEMPGELIEAQGEYEIEYDSPLSRVMKAEEAAGLSRWMEQTLAAVNVTQDPSPMDWFEWDVIQPELAEINAVPARWVATPDTVKAKRESRQEQQTIQTAIDAAPGMAGMMKATEGR